MSLKKTIGSEIGKEVILKVAGYGIGIGAVYFLVLRPILQKVGVIQTKEDKARAEQDKVNAGSQTSAFSPNLYKDKPGVLLLTSASANALADQIYNAIGNFYDDENAIYAALRQLKSKEQLSQLADVFVKRHAANLFTYLRRNLSDSEMDVINSITANLKGLSGFALGCACQPIQLNGQRLLR